jgi:hypothetical protein
MLGLAAIAVGLFMAFLGASSASATSLEEVYLCKALENPCANSHHGLGTVLHGVSIGATKLLGPITLLCEASHLLGELTSLLAHGKITAVSWLNCHEEGGAGEPCTVAQQHLPLLVKAELQANHTNYEALVTSGGSGRPAFRLLCPEAGECSFGSNTILFTVTHAGTGSSVILSVLQALSGEGFCFFFSGTFHAEYELKCLSGSSEVGCWPEMEPNVIL